MSLNATNIKKCYKNKTVIKDISLHLSQGEIVGLLGPNGAGKTTCFYMLAGLLGCDGGKIEIEDQDITVMPMYQRARLGIGYLPQESSIFRGLTVEENIMSILEYVEPDVSQRELKLEELLESFNLVHLRHSMSTTLSGGERRRLEIARAITTSPKYLLLDEPFAGVDPISVEEVRNRIKSLADNEIGILITDHNVRETLEIVDRAYIVHDGKILMHGKPDQIINNEQVKKVYLGSRF